tara:strand:- start:557 stop:1204 length:648 start_codon:yes stop_codon:yes gene_type:complete
MNLVFITAILTTVVEPLAIILNQKNHVSLTGSINEHLASKFISKINNIETNIIYIYINSPGGDVSAGQKIIQYINFKKNTNKTIACIAWEAHSMAFNIMQFCTYRYVLKDSKMMQHQMSLSGLSGNIENINSYIKVTNKMYDSLIKDASARIGITPTEYKTKINNDWYLYGEEIVKNNVADIVISSIGCDSKLTKYDTTETINTKPVVISLCPLV